MTQKTDQLIASLAEGSATKPLKPLALLQRWLAPSLAIVLVILLAHGLREDFSVAWQSIAFRVELLLSLCLAASAGITAVWFSYPDAYGHFRQRFVPLGLLTLLGALKMVQWQIMPVTPLDPAHHNNPLGELECTACVLLYAIFPGIILVHTLRKAATTHQHWAGALAALAVSALGYLTLRLIEPVDNVPHIFNFHFLPMIALSIAGVWLGQRLLKW